MIPGSADLLSPQQVAFTLRAWLQAEHRKHERFGNEREMVAGEDAEPHVLAACCGLGGPRS